MRPPSPPRRSRPSAKPDGASPAHQEPASDFDTPDLASYAEKANGDYLKTKLRLRWGTPLGRPARPRTAAPWTAWLEVKQRQGSRG